MVGLGLVSGLGIGWVHALWVPGRVRTPPALAQLTGILAGKLVVALGLGGHGWHLVRLAQHVGSLSVLLLAIWLVLRRGTGCDRGGVTAAAGLMLAAALLSPAAHYWYALWCLPLLACVWLPRAYEAAVCGRP